MAAVSIWEPRVKFIRGWLTGGTNPGDGSVEVGPETPWCMEVVGTPSQKQDQIAEIFYRVREYKTLGEIKFNVTIPGSPPTTGYRRQIFPDASPKNAPEGDLQLAFALPGLFTTSLELDPLDPDPMAHSPFFDPVVPISWGGFTVRTRVAKQEFGMWDRDITVPDIQCGWYADGVEIKDTSLGTGGYGSFPELVSDPDFFRFKAGFSFYSYDYPSTTAVGNIAQIDDNGVGTPYSDTATVIQIGNTVAWLDDDGSGNPFSSGNRLFLKFYFSSQCGGFPAFSAVSSTRIFSAATPPDQEIPTQRFKINLQHGQPEAIIYGWFNLGTWTFTGSTDLVLTPTRWWPYAKPDGSPQWDENTGAWL